MYHGSQQVTGLPHPERHAGDYRAHTTPHPLTCDSNAHVKYT